MQDDLRKKIGEIDDLKTAIRMKGGFPEVHVQQPRKLTQLNTKQSPYASELTNRGILKNDHTPGMQLPVISNNP